MGVNDTEVIHPSPPKSEKALRLEAKLAEVRSRISEFQPPEHGPLPAPEKKTRFVSIGEDQALLSAPGGLENSQFIAKAGERLLGTVIKTARVGRNFSQLVKIIEPANRRNEEHWVVKTVGKKGLWKS